MRFTQDYDHLRNEGFEVWMLEVREELRHKRLRQRGQEFCKNDEAHALEVELSRHPYHELINNDDELSAGNLARRIAELMRRHAPSVIA